MATKRNTGTEKPVMMNFGKPMLLSIARITIHHHHQDMWGKGWADGALGPQSAMYWKWV